MLKFFLRLGLQLILAGQLVAEVVGVARFERTRATLFAIIKSMNHRIRVGVLRGGPSSEYEVSLNTGANVLSALREKYPNKYETHDILIDKKGNWYIDGLPTTVADVCSRIDVAFNALHGSFGEDGKVQHILEIHGIPFTGSGAVASAVGMNKILTKNVLFDNDIKVPRHKEILSEDINADAVGMMSKLFQSVTLPVVVKPSTAGSSVGVSIVRDYRDFPEALLKASEHGPVVMVEEYIPGVEATCGVLENFRDQELYALPVVEIRPDNHFFDYEAKYAGKSREIVPAGFAENIKNEIHELAKKIHRVLGLKHYSRSDFIIHPKRGIYVLEVNTLPGLTEESLVPKSLRAVGAELHDLVDHVIGLAVGR